MHVALVLLLSAAMLTAAPKTSAWDQVQAIAKAAGHHLTIIPQNGYYHIDMDGSDISGAGKTMEDAAEVAIETLKKFRWQLIAGLSVVVTLLKVLKVI